MAVAKNKTVASKNSVAAFLAKIKPEQKRQDAIALTAALERITGQPAVMWGTAIVGFGSYHYVHDSGREGDMAEVGFSPRAASLTLYIHGRFADREALIAKLGNVKVSGSCVHAKSFADLNLKALAAVVTRPRYVRFLLDRTATDRIFAVTLVRIMLAYRTRSMRYCLLVFGRE